MSEAMHTVIDAVCPLEVCVNLLYAGKQTREIFCHLLKSVYTSEKVSLFLKAFSCVDSIKNYAIKG